MSLKKNAFALSVSLFIVPTFLVVSPGFTLTKKKPAADEAAPVCRAELLMEAESAEVLFEQNIHESLPPASMVKLMVAYVTMKKVEEGSVKLTDVITVSKHASKIGGSQVFLKEGEQFSLAQLLEAVLIQSANDAATSIAEHIGGTPEGFVEFMNAEAERLGMKETAFYSPHGLPPAKGQEPDLASAYDLSILARTIIKEFPQLLEYTGKPEGTFRDGSFVMRNHNHLVGTYPGCDGLKTGYYAQAGFGVTATAQRNGVRMITVLMGCKERRNRESEAARLFSTGFAKYRSVKLADKGVAADTGVRVRGGAKSEVIPVTMKEAFAVLRSGEEKGVRRKSNTCGEIQAPVQANTPCGSMSFYIGEKEVAKVALVISEDVPKGGLTARIKSLFR